MIQIEKNLIHKINSQKHKFSQQPVGTELFRTMVQSQCSTCMAIPLEKLYKAAVEQGKADDKSNDTSIYTPENSVWKGPTKNCFSGWALGVSLYARRRTSAKDVLERCCAHAI